MRRRLPRRAAVAAGCLLLVAMAIRVVNAFRYPADWGFDAASNWRYIYRLGIDRALPAPDAGWSTADPPLFFAVAALLFHPLRAVSETAAIVAVPLVNSLAGLFVAALTVDLVARVDPERPARALLAGGLVLFLPAHLLMSTMVNEEMFVALFASLGLYALSAGIPRSPSRRAAAVGLAAGLALLTKLSGAVSMAAGAASLLIGGARRRRWHEAGAGAAAVVVIAAAAGGWFYLRGSVLSAYLDPRGFDVHGIMRDMPPGERAPSDYASLPLATFVDPRALHPDLLGSVWGTTYATWWFDGHRHFLPTEGAGIRAMGIVILLLALLPTAAFVDGCIRGSLRCWRRESSFDLPLLAYLAVSVCAYVWYTWSNPYFAVVKGTSLLGAVLPFAFYASESLDRWTRGRTPVSLAVWGALAVLVAAVALTFSFGLVFERTEAPGIDWR